MVTHLLDLTPNAHIFLGLSSPTHTPVNPSILLPTILYSEIVLIRFLLNISNNDVYLKNDLNPK